MSNGSDLRPLPDVESLLVQRLAAFHKRIEGIASVLPTPGSTPLDWPDLPHMTHLIGPMPASIPTSGTRRTTMQRLIVARLLIAPVGAGEDVAEFGAMANAVAMPFFARLRNAYLRSPRLGIAGEAEEFAYLTQDIEFRDSGLVPRPGSGGAMYWLIDWTLTFNLVIPLPEGNDEEFYTEDSAEWYDAFGLS